jgi:hypothetical protein
MLFNSPEKWWEDGGQRNELHQGADFCFYRKRSGTLCSLSETTIVPAVYSGRIVKIIEDFVGKSIIMIHERYKNSGEQLLSVCGHTEPLGGITRGVMINDGQSIATITNFNVKNAKMTSHVHISIGWISRSLNYELLDWDMLSDPHMVTLLDPLAFMDCNYIVVDETIK